MKIDHVALYVKDLDSAKAFFETYFGGVSNNRYHNPTTGLETYFLTFPDGGRLEIMTKPVLAEGDRNAEYFGFTHLAFAAGTKDDVDSLTNRLAADGYRVLSVPRVTGDGYYESCIMDGEGNRIEIVASQKVYDKEEKTKPEAVRAKEIYYIGGSPCSGKSTTAEYLAEQFDLYYYKIDDFLFDYLERAARDGRPYSKAYETMTCDDLWLRDPEELMEEEYGHYLELFQYINGDLAALKTDKPIIAEGAALMPCLMKEKGIPADRYICIVPDAAFQNHMYAQRPWIDEILAESSDKKQAFANWMKRDELFALRILKEGEELGYQTITTTKDTKIGDTFRQVIDLFGLKKDEE